MELDAGSFNVRMRQFRRTPAGHSVAAGCIPPLEGHLTDKLTAATIVLKLVLEGAQKNDGSAKIMGKLRKYDSYVLGPQMFGKTRQ